LGVFTVCRENPFAMLEMQSCIILHQSVSSHALADSQAGVSDGGKQGSVALVVRSVSRFLFK
jgi:hypothetical protein